MWRVDAEKLAAEWRAATPFPHVVIDDVVGADELSRLSQQLGMGREEVAGGFAEILPEMVNQLTPDGSLPPDADDVLNNGTTTLEQYLNHARVR